MIDFRSGPSDVSYAYDQSARDRDGTVLSTMTLSLFKLPNMYVAYRTDSLEVVAHTLHCLSFSVRDMDKGVSGYS
jgi:hypothetical protein